MGAGLQGCFFDDANFSFSGWGSAYGASVLNAGAEVTTLEAFCARDYAGDSHFFVRPTDDSKSFAGEVMRFAELVTWCRQLEGEECDLSPDCPIVVAEPVEIAHEWRLFMVNSKVSTGSHYRSGGRLDVYADVPPEVNSFAEGLALRWQPAPVFVLDVARSGEKLYLIEVNCFNSAGFYASDVAKLVADVTRFCI